MLDARAHGLSEAVADDNDVRFNGVDVWAPSRRWPEKAGGHGAHLGGSKATWADVLAPNVVVRRQYDDPCYIDRRERAEREEVDEHLHGFATWVEGMRGKTIDELIAQCRSDSPTWPEDELRPWAESKQQMNPNISKMNISGGVKWETVVPGIKCPALLITADVEKHSIISAEMAAKAQQLCPQMEVAHIPGVGHNIRREDREAFMQAVEAFLARWAR
jgi:pimeloyl-ACP methyl ester carboxylesterase